MRICAVKWCDQPVKHRGWCGTHYTKWRRFGHPEGGRPCPTCEEFMGPGETGSFHKDCEPTLCTCSVPKPDGVGQCGTCKRLVLACSWHEGRPVIEQEKAA